MPAAIDLPLDALREPARVAEALASEALAGWLPARRWFSSKSRRIARVAVDDTFALLPDAPTDAAIAIIRVEYEDAGDADQYAQPFAVARGADAAAIAHGAADHVIATADEGRAIVHDLIGDAWGAAAMRIIANRETVAGERATLQGDATRACGALCQSIDGLPVRLLGVEQSNTSFMIGDRLIAKIVRRLEPGPHPDYEIGRHLIERTSFDHVPIVAGALQYRAGEGHAAVVVIAQALVPHDGNAWELALRDIDACFARAGDAPPPGDLPASLVEAALQPAPARVVSALGALVHRAQLLGRRTAELHVALASPAGDPAFEPAPLTADARAHLSDAMRHEASISLDLLDAALDRLTGQTRATAAALLADRASVLGAFDDLAAAPIEATRIRVHGDYHLGQVLVTGDDFVILDFEGEPRRSIADRRATQVALKDVAGMLRSYGYAAWAACFARAHDDESQIERLAGWTRWIESWLSVSFLRGYLDVARGTSFMPDDLGHLSILLRAFVASKALYEVRYEIDNRPTWLRIPLRGLTAAS